MAFLLDTGILLRLANAQDPRQPLLGRAVRTLIDRQERLFITTQNIAEFCNVATRPISNNGFGLTPANALSLIEREIEPICQHLLESESHFELLKRLIAKYGVVGKQVHDARLVAMMLAWQVDSILTLNDREGKFQFRLRQDTAAMSRREFES
jgi:predicted nucleic acid-binding protein